jgi:hypothetical protein
MIYAKRLTNPLLICFNEFFFREDIAIGIFIGLNIIIITGPTPGIARFIPTYLDWLAFYC